MDSKMLIKNAMKGDSRSQRLLFDSYSPMLFSVCMRYCKSREEAEDALQDAWIKIFNSLEQYESRGKFEAWLRTIAINTSIRRRQKLYFVNEKNGYEILPDYYENADILESMHADEILSMIDRLPDGYAEVFKLFVIDDFKHKEIAEIMGISESTSRVKLTMARRKLQKMIINLDKHLAHE
ncbi:MAG TPA: RNA polymerase sigma factor [Saprospiraceae bacterium]|nr:RNA polymerase sigma factor [Saprospiraceae bacterium]HPK10887.1 RNA polymerase sigma factor [Saprospiraceae bacterium]HRX29548.1 RNA polymerase sigma factor [Saprospiraceae bacterium]